jgi:hypothetical protein
VEEEIEEVVLRVFVAFVATLPVVLPGLVTEEDGVSVVFILLGLKTASNLSRALVELAKAEAPPPPPDVFGREVGVCGLLSPPGVDEVEER